MSTTVLFQTDMEKKNGILPVSLVTADEMRAYDTYTIQNIGIHTEVLMERAALALADECMLLLKDAHKKPREAKALCVCGTGNNGGDGLACARLLADRGVEVKVLLVGNKEKLSEAAAYEYRILQAYCVPVVSFGEEGFPAEEYSVIVDALFGTGLSRKITGDYKQVIETINDLPGKVVAADIPSGIDSDTGKIWGTAIMVDRTVTFGFAKRGLYLYPGASVCRKGKDCRHRHYGKKLPYRGAWHVYPDGGRTFPLSKPQTGRQQGHLRKNPDCGRQ